MRVSSHGALVKQGLYTFHVRVRDEAGKPVEDAAVHLQLHSFKEPGYRLVRAKHLDDGLYQVTARIHEGVESRQHVRAVVAPSGDRR
ncbi:MAG: hypothetical protein ACK47B_03980 [Armatimonadota bacterium]